MRRKRIINPIFKDTALFLETKAESNGRHTLAELELLPGGGNPMHYHTRFSETFTAVEGKLQLNLAKGIIILKPGETFTVEPGQHHCFYNPGQEKIVFRIEIKPGDTGFEHFIHILYKMAGDGRTNKKGIPKDLKITSLLTVMGDAYPVGFLSLLKPLIKFLAKRAMKQGLDKVLIQHYCREEYFEVQKVAV